MSASGCRWARVAVVVAAVSALLGGSPAGRAEAAAPTIVTLTFDDGHASHAGVLAPLQTRGMAGTFYINSGKVGSSPYLGWDQIAQLAAAGNEIGGHTIDHARLSRLSEAEARRQICDDRQALLSHGLQPTSFAYPYGDVTPGLETLVAACGYSSGRALGGVKSGTVCRSCPYAETVPPRDAYAVRTLRHLTPTTTLAELQGYVTHAESSGGGWVVLVFHGVCDDRCTGTYSYSATSFGRFLDWLAPRAGSGTVVRTVQEVVAG
jgi:peptidoglycan/xylan/chitin deacetylase (PgdA/CDA1 family)